MALHVKETTRGFALCRDEGQMPTCPAFVPAMAEICVDVAGCTPWHLLDAAGRYARLEQGLLDAIAQIQVRLLVFSWIISRFGSEQPAEHPRQVGRDLVAAAPDARPDGHQDAAWIGPRGMLQRPDGPGGDRKPRPPPPGMDRGRHGLV